MKTYSARNPGLPNETVVTPMGNHIVRLDAEGTGTFPHDCGIHMVPGFTVINGQPTELVATPEADLVEKDGPLVRVRAPRDIAGELVRAPSSFTVAFDRDAMGVCPDNCGLDQVPGYYYVGYVNPDQDPRNQQPEEDDEPSLPFEEPEAEPVMRKTPAPAAEPQAVPLIPVGSGVAGIAEMLRNLSPSEQMELREHLRGDLANLVEPKVDEPPLDGADVQRSMQETPVMMDGPQGPTPERTARWDDAPIKPEGNGGEANAAKPEVQVPPTGVVMDGPNVHKPAAVEGVKTRSTNRPRAVKEPAPRPGATVPDVEAAAKAAGPVVIEDGPALHGGDPVKDAEADAETEEAVQAALDAEKGGA